MQNDAEKKEQMLLLLAKNGDEKALALLATKYLPAIKKYSAHSLMPWLDFDDAVQEGLIGFFRAVQTYQNGKNASFKTYANVCIKNAVVAAQRAAGRKKHAPLNQSIPFTSNMPAQNSADKTAAKESLALVLKKARVLLSQREKQVLQLLLHGFTKQEIAEKIGCTLKSVENCITRMRNKLK